MEVKTILRAKRYYTLKEVMSLYKCHVLSYLEFSTPAIYHTSTSTLGQVERVQARLLREVGLSKEEALLEYHLAPLHTRRDIAMLGLIHIGLYWGRALLILNSGSFLVPQVEMGTILDCVEANRTSNCMSTWMEPTKSC